MSNTGDDFEGFITNHIEEHPDLPALVFTSDVLTDEGPYVCGHSRFSLGCPKDKEGFQHCVMQSCKLTFKHAIMCDTGREKTDDEAAECMKLGIPWGK